ncbi:DUF6114 domain-containing protein [Streptomyces sp. NPDC007088]|uniref:DUF6114 domain-containing protein n=1 Tax=Streptomyces sp. NPDC007088 TaxID=3364773 RepID=UPI00368DDF81
MSAESPGLSHRIHHWRLRFRAWRGTRPFWAGLLTLLGGIPIAYLPYNDLKLGQLTLRMATTAGAGSLIIGILLITLGLTMWYHHIVRVFAGVAAILLALISIPVSNLGGLFFGFLLAMVGGALSLSWAPAKPPSDEVTPAGLAAPAPGGTPGPPPGTPGGPAPTGGDPLPGPERGGPAGPAPAGDDGRPFAQVSGDGGRHRAE